MKIYVDADACPRMVKELLYKTANRLKVNLILVANQYIRTEDSDYIRFVEVGAGADIADDRIVELVESGDLVISADIPLADRVIKKGGFVLDPRGSFLTEENISSRLAVRDLMEDLRTAGEISGGPAAYGPKDKQAFNNQLDAFLTRQLK